MATLVQVVSTDRASDSGSVMSKRGVRLRSGLATTVYPDGDKSTLSTNLSGSNNDLTFTARQGGTWGDNISVTYVVPSDVPEANDIAIQVDNMYDIVVNLGMDADTQASLSTALTGNNNDLTFTAVDYGTDGNSITITYDNTGSPSETLAIGVASTDITVTLETDAGTAASATLTSDNTEIADGDTVTVNDVTYRFKDTMAQANDVQRHGTVADTTLGNLVAAINGSGTPGSEYFAGTSTPTGVTAAAVASHATVITADAVGTAANSFPKSTTATHLSWDAGGGGTTFSGGVAPAILTTAAEIITLVEGDAPASALVTVANKTGNDGSGVVTALTQTALAGGAFGAANTAAEVKAAIEAHPEANDLVTVANKTGNDGTGAVIALSKTNLASGANGSKGEKFYQTANNNKPVWVNIDDPVTARALKKANYKIVRVA